MPSPSSRDAALPLKAPTSFRSPRLQHRLVPWTLDAQLPPLLQRFRRSPLGCAQASQPSLLRLARPSNSSRANDSPCSALHRCAHAATMASADCCASVAASLNATSSLEQKRNSPRVRSMTFAPSIRRIYARPIRVTSGFGSFCPLAHQTVASYAVRVPRTIALPAASFPHRLTTMQLQFS
jgi:hypothetical protein